MIVFPLIDRAVFVPISREMGRVEPPRFYLVELEFYTPAPRLIAAASAIFKAAFAASARRRAAK